MDRSEVEIPYRDGPLDGERELRERWELDDVLAGVTEPDVYVHKDFDSSEPGERYQLTYVDRHAGWVYQYIGPEEPST